jgi:hypothetical protein
MLATLQAARDRNRAAGVVKPPPAMSSLYVHG